MSQKTSIGWTDRSANPIRARHKATGKAGWHCVMTSRGCANCYSHALNGRFGTGLLYNERSGDEVEVFFDRKPMDAILRMKTFGHKFFPCDMTDLFADFVPDEFIDRMFAYFASCGRQTFQVLTKRIDRAERWFARVSEQGATHANLYQSRLIDYYSRHGVDLSKPYQVPARPTPELRFIYNSALGIDPACRIEDQSYREEDDPLLPRQCQWRGWPLDNVWIGCSVEDQEQANRRLPILRRIPAAIRWASYEPMLAPVDWEAATPCGYYCDESAGHVDHSLSWLNWVVLGGESGPNRRPMEVGWLADSIEQLRRWRVACFVKQDTGPKPGMQGRIPDDLWAIKEFPTAA